MTGRSKTGPSKTEPKVAPPSVADPAELVSFNGVTLKVAVISGKGGVGKTSITASLAYLLAQAGLRLTLVDADVDAPNAALLCPPAGNVREYAVKTTEKADFDPDLCVNCKQCITEVYCTFGALSWDPQTSLPVIDRVACEGCRACELLCPAHAFSVEMVESGRIRSYRAADGFQFIGGETILGSQTSGKLVTELRKAAESQPAGDEGAEGGDSALILIDGPPGIGCPVLAAITGVDFVVLVTEPTKAALHDVERAIAIVEGFKIPFGLVINKCDMNSANAEAMRAHFGEKSYEILGEIPLLANWADAIVHQQPIAKYFREGMVYDALWAIARRLSHRLHALSAHRMGAK